MMVTVCSALFTACHQTQQPASDTQAAVFVLNTLTVPERETHRVYVNGQPIGELKSRQYTWFQLPPGTHDITISGTPLFDNPLSAQKLKLRAGQIRYLVYDQEMRAPYLLEYAENHATKWLAKARFVSNRILRSN